MRGPAHGMRGRRYDDTGVVADNVSFQLQKAVMGKASLLLDLNKSKVWFFLLSAERQRLFRVSKRTFFISLG